MTGPARPGRAGIRVLPSGAVTKPSPDGPRTALLLRIPPALKADLTAAAEGSHPTMSEMSNYLEELAGWIDAADAHHARLISGNHPPSPGQDNWRKRLRVAYSEALDDYYTALGLENGL